MSNISTPDIIATRFVGALYGESLSYQQQQYVLTNSANLTNIMNALYTSDFGTQTNAQVAATVVSNLGITGNAATIATNVITADLNAAVAGQQGATIAGILNGFATMTGNPTFGSFATAWETKVGAADAASSVVGAGNQQLGNISTNLTTNGPGATFTAGVQVPAGALVLNDAGNGTNASPDTITAPAGSTILASQLTVNGAGVDAITLDSSVAAWSTVATETVNGGAAITLTGSATNSITANASAVGAVSVNGGLNDTVTSTQTSNGAATALGSISIGATTAAAGTATLTSTQTFDTALSTLGNITAAGTTGVTVTSVVNDTTALIAYAGVAPNSAALITVTDTSGAVVVNSALNITDTGLSIATVANKIAVTGGTTVTVNETVSADDGATAISTITEGAVGITGNANTTTVTVNQAAKATGTLVAAAVTAVLAADGVNSVTAGPGLNATSAVTATNSTAAAAATTSAPTVTADGAVTIADKNAASGTLANTISTVTLNNYSASTIASNALTTLTLSGTGSTLGITNANTAAGTAHASTLTLNVNNLSYTGAGGTTNAITDVSSEIATLNIVTGATASSILGAATYSTTALTDANLKTVNVSGSSVLTMGAYSADPTTITVTGAAGYTGLVTDTTTIFNASGSTGKDIIGLGATPTKLITGSSFAGNEVVITGANVADSGTSAANYSAFNTDVTGFSTLGVAVTGKTWDMSKLSSSFNAVSVEGGAAWGGPFASASFTNVVAGTALNVTGAMSGTLSYATADTNGSTDSVVFTDNANGIIATASFADVNGNGIGSLSISSGTGANTITTLTDLGLTSLTVSGSKALTIGASTTNALALTLTNNSTYLESTAVAAPTAGYSSALTPGLTITTLTAASDGTLNFAGTGSTEITKMYAGTTTTHLTINSTDSAPVQILALSGAAVPTVSALNTLTFTGTGNVDIGVLDTSSATLTIANTGTGTVAVGDYATAGLLAANLATLTLTGNVQVGTNSATAMTVTGVTTALTISAGTDNAHLNLHTDATANGSALTVTLGNGNDFFTSDSSAGQLTMTFGTGYNKVDLHTGIASTYSANLTFGSHTSTSTLQDYVLVGKVAATAAAPNTVITGFGANDKLYFVDAAVTLQTLTAGQLNTAAAYGTLAAAVGYVDALVGTIHSVTSFVWGGNTYVLNSAAAGNGTLTANDELVELIGTHTLSTVVSHVATLTA